MMKVGLVIQLQFCAVCLRVWAIWLLFYCLRSSDDENMEEQQRYERPVGDPLQACDSEKQESSGRKKPALVRYTALAFSLIGVVTISTW